MEGLKGGPEVVAFQVGFLNNISLQPKCLKIQKGLEIKHFLDKVASNLKIGFLISA